MALIRVADKADARAMLAVYAPYVRDTAISFETEPPAEDEFRGRVRSTQEVGTWLVCEGDDGVLGYAYGGRFHARAAYQWTSETTVYVDARYHRRGVALGLYTALLDCLGLQGFRSAVGVLALPNPGSVALHERLGFTRIGVLPAAGYKHGRWHDIGWWRRVLGEHDASPAPPRPLAAVCRTAAWRDALEAGATLVRA